MAVRSEGIARLEWRDGKHVRGSCDLWLVDDDAAEASRLFASSPFGHLVPQSRSRDPHPGCRGFFRCSRPVEAMPGDDAPSLVVGGRRYPVTIIDRLSIGEDTFFQLLTDDRRLCDVEPAPGVADDCHQEAAAS